MRSKSLKVPPAEQIELMLDGSPTYDDLVDSFSPTLVNRVEASRGPDNVLLDKIAWVATSKNLPAGLHSSEALALARLAVWHSFHLLAMTAGEMWHSVDNFRRDRTDERMHQMDKSFTMLGSMLKDCLLRCQEASDSLVDTNTQPLFQYYLYLIQCVTTQLLTAHRVRKETASSSGREGDGGQ
eukprot:GHVQ01016705.1.p1 GENE.GHVQ01016705.1~~GHVQ01016705.1.p1  ORF type:complete len:183 (+),score=9.80 GHVQ01016705.1:730-1278(+)